MANLIPRACVQVVDFYRRENIEEAQKVQAIVARAGWLAIKGGFVAVKIALESYGVRRTTATSMCRVAPSEHKATATKESIHEGIELENAEY